MFTSTLRSALIAFVASAAVVSATPGLTLTTSGPSAVDGVDNLKITTTLTNTGDEELKLLNNPNTILHKFPTNTFAIASQDGVNPKFVGAKVKYEPSVAAKMNDASAFTILSPGASIEIEHDLSEAYDFTDGGESEYAIEPSNLFYYVDPATGEPVAIRADADFHMSHVAGKLAVPRVFSPLSKRAAYNGCSAARQSALQQAAPAAQSYVSNAFQYLQSRTSATTRYTTWFGAYTDSRRNTVLDHFSKMNGNSYTSYTYDCTCTDAGTYAYVYPNNFGRVYLCGAFWNAPNTGTDSKAGTLVHESSHFKANGGTNDVVYGQAGAKSLARSNPDQAITNADSHEYFAENNPALS